MNVEKQVVKLAEDQTQTDIAASDVLADVMDSLDVVEFVMAIEEEFDVHIDDSTWREWKLVQDAIDFVNNNLENKSLHSGDL